MGDGARQQQGSVEPRADLLDQCERRLCPGMSAGTGGHGDDAVGALLDGLVCEAVVDDVVEDDPAVGMDGFVDLFTGTE